MYAHYYISSNKLLLRAFLFQSTVLVFITIQTNHAVILKSSTWLVQLTIIDFTADLNCHDWNYILKKHECAFNTMQCLYNFRRVDINININIAWILNYEF